jgi:hypothetical protein
LILFYLLLLLGSGVINYIFTIAILRELAASRPGMHFFDLRWHVLKNLGTYRDLTRARYGRTGIPYYGYLATLAVLILSAALLLQSLGG